MIFSSTPETNDDPKPWIAWGVRYAEKIGTTYSDPRPEFNRAHTPNPILVDARERLARNPSLDWRTLARYTLNPHNLRGRPLAQCAHARRVLNRLAAITETYAQEVRRLELDEMAAAERAD